MPRAISSRGKSRVSSATSSQAARSSRRCGSTISPSAAHSSLASSQPTSQGSSQANVVTSSTDEGLLSIIRAEFQRLSQSLIPSSGFAQSVASGPATLQSQPTCSVTQPCLMSVSEIPNPGSSTAVPTFPSVASGLPGVLGSLPPPSALVSLPVSSSLSVMGTSHIFFPTWTIPANLGATPASTTLVVSPAPFLNTPLAGLILSPASDPIPRNLVLCIQSGQFVEMRDLLTDNIAGGDQLSSLQGTMPLPHTVVSCTWFREVPSLVSWLYCLCCCLHLRPDPATRNMLAYSRLLIREALRYGGRGWLEYDQVFRRQLAINPALPWNTIEPGLQAATILGQGPAVGVFCSCCSECDHIASQYAMAPIQQVTTNKPASSSQQVTTNTLASSLQPAPTSTHPLPGSRPAKRPETLLHMC